MTKERNIRTGSGLHVNPTVYMVRALICSFVLVFGGCASLNNYQTKGTLTLEGLDRPVNIHRDDKGMAYIYAESLDDALLAQGFVTAQDRLFQMELTRLFAQGRIGEMVGEKARDLDTRMRTIGFHRNAKKHAAILSYDVKRVFQKYLDGVNAYIQTRGDSRHLEFKLAGIQPEPWTLPDALSILYYMSWNSAANLKSEIIAQMLLDRVGITRAKEILPLNINPDDPADKRGFAYNPAIRTGQLNLATDGQLKSYLDTAGLQIGSNNWAAGAGLSAGGKPVVANDPHLDARMLPGPWYPCGIVMPGNRAVGVTIPGLPGLLVFRNDDVAVGVTNSYGDAQDLYIETIDPVDPDRYLEGQSSLPFEVIEETLTLKDKKAPDGIRREKIRIRLTGRGPVVSGILPKLKTDRVITLRWSSIETMGPELGLDRLMTARSAKEVREALADVNMVMLNFVFADTAGNIGWQTSGKLPIRSRGDGTFPLAVTGVGDNWRGWIPSHQMPGSANPERGWVGTCNHKTVATDYPYYFSSHQAPSYRYRRLKELMESPGKKKAADHWAYQRDTLNLMARAIAPVMARALYARENTRKMGDILLQWDFRDDPDKAAPTIFQAVYRRFALLTFQDELGVELAHAMLDNWYFWQERLQRMMLEGNSPWFDDTQTSDVTETRDMLFHRAAMGAAEELKEKLGKDPSKWLWGDIHRIAYVSPIRRSGFGKGLLGGGSYAAAGSCETLHRNIYDFSKPFDVTVSASLRMVADLADDEKVLAALPGGVSGRLFHPHTKNQVKPFMNGEKMYWWFSDQAIAANSRTILVLSP